MKSSWFGDSKRAEFAKLIDSADYGRHFWDTIGDWIECMWCTLQQASRRSCGMEIDPEIEKRYLRAIGGYKYPERFPEALPILVDALTERPYDFLGHILTEVEVTNKPLGQFFTPPHVCDAMARMTVGVQDLSWKDYLSKPLRLQEPACGGGQMLISVTNHMRELGWPNRCYHWTAIDVDWRMAATAYIQTTLLDIPCTVFHGSALGDLEKLTGWPNMAAIRTQNERDNPWATILSMLSGEALNRDSQPQTTNENSNQPPGELDSKPQATVADIAENHQEAVDDGPSGQMLLF